MPFGGSKKYPHIPLETTFFFYFPWDHRAHSDSYENRVLAEQVLGGVYRHTNHNDVIRRVNETELPVFIILFVWHFGANLYRFNMV